MASNDDDIPSIEFGDYQKTDRTEVPQKVTVTEALIRSYIQGNFEGSPNAYKPGNIGIEKNSNGGDVYKNGDLMPHPYGVVRYTNNEKNGENKNKPYVVNNRYISCLPPMYKGYKTDDGLSGASTTKAYINSEEVAYIVTTFASGMKKGDIGYIERLNPNDGTVMDSIFCMLADSNTSGVYNSDELKADDKKGVFCFDPIKKATIQVPKLKTEISYYATQKLGIKVSGSLWVSQKTFNTNKDNKRYTTSQGYDKNDNQITEYWETVNDNKRKDIENFTYMQIPDKLRINIGYVMDGVEVFKFDGVTDAHAVLRIRIFKNSGDTYAHSQEEIEKAGKQYYKALIEQKASSTDYVGF